MGPSSNVVAACFRGPGVHLLGVDTSASANRTVLTAIGEDEALVDAVVAAASLRDGRPPTLVSLGIRIGNLAGQIFDNVQIVRLPRSSSRLPQRWRVEGPGDQLSMAS